MNGTPSRDEAGFLPNSSSPGRIAGIDYGTVRIGVAVSDARRVLASPLENYTRRGESADAAHFRQLAAEEQISLFVVGLPVHLSGQESQKSQEARRFGTWLAEVTGVRVEYYDERFTSAQAEQFLLSGKMTRKRRQKRRDMLAAQLMLAAYLESGGRAAEHPGSLDDREDR